MTTINPVIKVIREFVGNVVKTVNTVVGREKLTVYPGKSKKILKPQYFGKRIPLHEITRYNDEIKKTIKNEDLLGNIQDKFSKWELKQKFEDSRTNFIRQETSKILHNTESRVDKVHFDNTDDIMQYFAGSSDRQDEVNEIIKENVRGLYVDHAKDGKLGVSSQFMAEFIAGKQWEKHLIRGETPLERMNTQVSRPKASQINFLLDSPFRGNESFTEVNNDIMYIPTSGKCTAKLMKYLYPEINYEEVCEKVSRNGVTIKEIAKIYKSYSGQVFPRIFTFGDGIMTAIDGLPENVNENRVYTVPTSYKNYLHVALIKAGKTCTIQQVIEACVIEQTFKLDPVAKKCYETKKEKPLCSVFMYDFEAYISPTIRQTKIPLRSEDGRIITDNNGKKQYKSSASTKQNAYGVSFRQAFDHENPVKGENFAIVGDDCAIKMIEKVSTLCPGQNIIFYAYNAGKYDTFLIKQVKELTFSRTIKIGGSYKELEVKYNNCTMLFRDLKDFCTGLQLKDALKSFKCTPKLDFDIAGKDKKWYDDNMTTLFNGSNWIDYMKQDTDSIHELIHKLNDYFKLLGFDIRENITVSGMAWKLMLRNCHHLRENTKIPMDYNTSSFIRKACKGGRVFAWKRVFNSVLMLPGMPGFNPKYIKPEIAEKRAREGDASPFSYMTKLISLDINSMYPDAMAKFAYPIGDAIVIKDEAQFREINESGRLYIAEVELLMPNQDRILLPYKTDGTKISEKLAQNTTSDILTDIINEEQNMLIYRTGLIQDIWTSVDIQNAVHDGAIIKKFIRGMYWEESAFIFRELVLHLYNMRKKLQVENNAFEVVIKIILNSMYGKLLEKIDKEVYFLKYKDLVSEDGKLVPKDLGKKKYHTDPTVKPLNNGQYEVSGKFETFDEKKPIHLAAFVLSYSKHNMNNIIRELGIENVYYSDTDSLYVDETTLTDEFRSKYMNSNLGNMKNDYGTNSFITNAIFLGQKRYLLNIIDEKTKTNSYKMKFTGINFRKGKEKEVFSDFLTDNINESAYDIILRFFIGLLVNNKCVKKGPEVKEVELGVMLERWQRSHDNITIYTDKFFYHNDIRGRGSFVKKNSEILDYFIPIGFDPLKPIIPFQRQPLTLKQHKVNENQFKYVNGTLKISILPISSEPIMIKCKDKTMMTSTLIYERTSSSKLLDNLYYAKNTTGGKFEGYKMCEFGATNQVKELNKNDCYWVFAVPEKFSHVISSKMTENYVKAVHAKTHLEYKTYTSDEEMIRYMRISNDYKF